MGLERILIIDDDQSVIDTISTCLKREGFEIISALDGNRALSLVKESSFDLTLIDINLSGMDGFELMDRILAVDNDIFVVMITEKTSIESSIKSLNPGVWDYLKKPFEPSDLIKAVKNALRQKKLLEENRQMTAKLAATEKQYEYMVNNSPDLIFILDINSCFVFANNQFEHLLGIRRQDLIGQPFSNILHPSDISKASALYELSREEGRHGKDLNIHLRLKKINTNSPGEDIFGSYAFVELKAVAMYLPVKNQKEVFAGIYSVARDVSFRVSLEDQLRQSQKMQAIGTLAGGIAHDFNNILMGIQGYASLVRTELKPGSIEFKRLRRIDEYVQSGAEMSKQLLGFAQKGFQETTLININYLLKLSAKMFGRTKKDIIIQLNLAKKLWSTQVDEGQIKQILMNLFVNAWQAMPRGGKIIIKSENIIIDATQIEKLGLDETGKYVKITVSDTGEGIKKEILDQIFDPFFTTKERGKGTGLGLATAYGIIKSHRGTFQVESMVGQGSSFSFFLPANDIRVKKKKSNYNKENIISGKGNILLIDDEEGVIEVCSEMILAMGYKVKAVTSGIEAINILSSQGECYDLVILDWVMPGMDGDETFEQIKKMRPATKILFSSGYSKKEKIEKMVEKGCDGYILKPFDMATLSEKLDSILQKENKKTE